MFFDTYRLATLRITEDLRQAAHERALRAIGPDPVTDGHADVASAMAPVTPALAAVTASVTATGDHGEPRSAAAA